MRTKLLLYNVLLILLSSVTRKLIATQQSFRYMELADAKIWISNNVLLYRFYNQVTYMQRVLQLQGKTIISGKV